MRGAKLSHYGYHKPDGHGYSVQSLFDESKMDTLLDAARAAGVITMHDTGRGAIVWFEGPPSEALEDLHVAVLKLLPSDAVRY